MKIKEGALWISSDVVAFKELCYNNQRKEKNKYKNGKN
ncbi:MAG: hypothetical protein QG620_763 [Patescibacteria group bacterium]|nr:hypothetical protein [Patescibacteria group bacterium]